MAGILPHEDFPHDAITHAENYLNERRQLGFKLRSSGYSIKSFARYFDALGYQGAPTIEIIADWARLDKGNSNKPVTWARRLNKLRSFARYLQHFRSKPKSSATKLYAIRC